VSERAVRHVEVIKQLREERKDRKVRALPSLPRPADDRWAAKRPQRGKYELDDANIESGPTPSQVRDALGIGAPTPATSKSPLATPVASTCTTPATPALTTTVSTRAAGTIVAELEENAAMETKSVPEKMEQGSEEPMEKKPGANEAGQIKRDSLKGVPRLRAAVERLTNGGRSKEVPRILASANFEEWKSRRRFTSDTKVFIVIGGYPDLKRELLERGWVENPDPESPYFDLKWTLQASDIDQKNLRPTQVVNHFVRNRELTTKCGITMNMREAAWRADQSCDEFYPCAFNLADALERDDFVCTFQLNQAFAVLKRFMMDALNAPKDMLIYGESVLYAALAVCERAFQNVDDVLDSDLADHYWQVKPTEWEILGQVSLERPAERVTLDLAPKPAAPQELQVPIREQEQKDDKKVAAVIKKKKKKKKKVVEEDPEPIEWTCEAGYYQEKPRGKWLVQRVRSALESLRKLPQDGITGTQNAWIIKPAGKSRGRGIQMVKKLGQILKLTETEESLWICQKYIERPLLIGRYKFDIRQWVLVKSWNPLTVYMWREPYIRFAAEPYDDLLDDNSSFIHLVNNSIVKNHPTFDQGFKAEDEREGQNFRSMDDANFQREPLRTEGLMWFKQDFMHWLHARECKKTTHCTPFLTEPPKTCKSFGVDFSKLSDEDKLIQEDEDGDAPYVPVADAKDDSAAPGADHAAGPPKEAPQMCACGGGDECPRRCVDPWSSRIWPEMKRIVATSLTCVMDLVESRKGTCELFGYDFMLSADLKVWLIEVNSSPAMDYSTPVTLPLVKSVMHDVPKVLFDAPESEIVGEAHGEWELIIKGNAFPTRPPISIGAKLELAGKRIRRKGKKKKKKKNKKKKALAEPLVSDAADLLADHESDSSDVSDSDRSSSSD